MKSTLLNKQHYTNLTSLAPLDQIAIPEKGIIYLTAYNTPLALGFEEQDGTVLMVNEYLIACKWMRKAATLAPDSRPVAIICEPDFLDDCGDSIITFRNSDRILRNIPFIVLGDQNESRARQLRAKGVSDILPFFFDKALLDHTLKALAAKTPKLDNEDLEFIKMKNQNSKTKLAKKWGFMSQISNSFR
jgi:hypothetical protein